MKKYTWRFRTEYWDGPKEGERRKDGVYEVSGSDRKGVEQIARSLHVYRWVEQLKIGDVFSFVETSSIAKVKDREVNSCKYVVIGTAADGREWQNKTISRLISGDGPEYKISCQNSLVLLDGDRDGEPWEVVP